MTFLWSTSWVLITIGLADLALEPLGFAGLRYTLAALVLPPLTWRQLRRPAAARPGRRLAVRPAALRVRVFSPFSGAAGHPSPREPAARSLAGGAAVSSRAGVAPGSAGRDRRLTKRFGRSSNPIVR